MNELYFTRVMDYSGSFYIQPSPIRDLCYPTDNTQRGGERKGERRGERKGERGGLGRAKENLCNVVQMQKLLVSTIIKQTENKGSQRMVNCCSLKTWAARERLIAIQPVVAYTPTVLVIV